MEEIQSNLQSAKWLYPIAKRIDALNVVLKMCQNEHERLRGESSCFDYQNFRQRKDLEKMEETIQLCIIDAKLKPLW